MIIDVNQNVILLSGNLSHNCWDMLRARAMRILRDSGEVTIYCEGLTGFTPDGIQTLALAQLPVK